MTTALLLATHHSYDDGGLRSFRSDRRSRPARACSALESTGLWF
jgi:hypothetical protein